MIKLEVKKIKKEMEVNFQCEGADISEIIYGIARLWLFMTTYCKISDKDILKDVKLTMKNMKAQNDK